MCMNLFREGRPKAAKRRPCIWCGEAILQGERHRQQVGTVYGELQDNRYHEECYEVALESFRRGDCDFDDGEQARPAIKLKDL